MDKKSHQKEERVKKKKKEEEEEEVEETIGTSPINQIKCGVDISRPIRFTPRRSWCHPS